MDIIPSVFLHYTGPQNHEEEEEAGMIFSGETLVPLPTLFLSSMPMLCPLLYSGLMQNLAMKGTWLLSVMPLVYAMELNWFTVKGIAMVIRRKEKQ